MVSSKETTPAAYLDSLAPEHRTVIATVRTMVKKNLPKGFVESMNWGMLCYELPLSRYPDTYNKQPLMLAGLAAQKNNYALYLTNIHDPEATHQRLAAAYRAKGRKFDMGKSCLRFKSLDELPMDLLAEIIAAQSVEGVIARYEGARASSTPAKKSAAKSAGTKRATSAGTVAAKKPATKQAVKKAVKKTVKKAVAKTAVKKSARKS